MTDIVDMLRTLRERHSYMDWSEMLTEAADEIVRLREALSGAIPTRAARDVLAERQRQIRVEGWSPERDDFVHDNGGIALAAASYSAYAHVELHGDTPILWPWDKGWWKPGDPRRMLVKSGALLLAEIERLDRSPQPAQENKK